jgi:hypothetical protein
MFDFLNPVFLVFGGAAVVPLVLHLIQSSRKVRMPFSTVRFLKMAEKKSSRRIKMENLLLWILRTAIMAIISLAFAMPMLRTKSFGKVLGRTQRDIAVVIDGSFSMDYNMGKDTAFTRAVDAAVAIIEGLEEGDQVCVFVATDEVTPLVGQLNAQRDFVLGQVKSLKVGTTSSQLAPATVAAYDALKQETRRREREVHIITDGQAIPWHSFTVTYTNINSAIEVIEEKSSKKDKKEDKKKDDKKKDDKKEDKKTKKGESEATVKSSSIDVWQPAKIDKKTAFFVTLTGVTAPENTAPTDVELQPQLIMSDTTAKMKIKLVHTGPAQNSTITVFVDDQEIGTRAVIFQDSGIAEELFALPQLKAGRHSARIQSPADNLPIDNNFYFTVKVKERLPSLCVGTQNDSFFVMKALNPTGDTNATINVKQIVPEQLPSETLSDYSCIFLCNAIPMAGQDMIPIEQYARSGGLLVIFPGDKATAEDYKAWSTLPAVPGGLKDLPLEQRKKMLRWEKPQHPLLRTLQLPPGSAPVTTILRQLRMDKLSEGGETVISAGAEEPFLAHRPVGNGETIMFAVAADRSWSSFPLSPFYLPLMHQIVQFGAGIRGETPYIWATRNLPLADTIPEASQNSTIQSPTKENVPIRTASIDNRASLYVENMTTPGVYILTPQTGESGPALAVNIDRKESTLDVIKREDIPKKVGTKTVFTAENKEELMKQLKEYRVGQTMGEQILWLILILSAMEVFYANRLARSTPKLSDQLGIEASGKITEQG